MVTSSVLICIRRAWRTAGCRVLLSTTHSHRVLITKSTKYGICATKNSATYRVSIYLVLVQYGSGWTVAGWVSCRGGVWCRSDLVLDLVFFRLTLSASCLFPCLLVLILVYHSSTSCRMLNLENEQQHVHKHDAHQNLSRFWSPPISFWSRFAGETNISSNPAWRHIFSSK